MQLGEFKAIPIPFFGGSYVHYLYVKQNKAKEGDQIDASKSLIATNLPIDFNEKDIGIIFEQVAVPNVFLNSLQTQEKLELSIENVLNLDETNFKNATNQYGKYAVIIFENRKQAKAALNINSINKETINKLDSILKEKQRGMKKWISEYNSERPHSNKLQKEVDSFMATFDKNKKQEEENMKEEWNKPDEDGFIKVTYSKGKKTHSDGVAHVTATTKKNLKQKDLSIQNFYRFQKGDDKRKQLETLKHKFEEDKARIARMRANRKFRPY